ncbi:MAG TPA: hypothetical protein VHS99_14940 [Chloroflexota bacterium]|jgi:hypothetical protein|nr:hypothetical protein [Chloroflexota bacterium]
MADTSQREAASGSEAEEPSAARPLPKEIEDALRGVSGAETPAQAALTLSAIANRAVAELNKLARAEANRRRGQPDWGTWAGLANAARDAVLRVSTCRKAAVELARKVQGASSE